MALFQVQFFSQTLKLSTSMNVIIPEPAQGMIGQESDASDLPPVLYLLHGLSDDHSIWVRRTSVERYASARGLAVVMPAVDRSYYSDMAVGLDYWRFVSEEIPALVSRFFKVSTSRERTFVAGLSMGGYGALKLGFNFPERFAAVASFSGAVDPHALYARFQGHDDLRARAGEFRAIFGDPPEIIGTRRDLFHLASALSDADGSSAPALYISCGTGDELITQNRALRDHLQSNGLDLEYREEPGIHEWGFWDRHIEQFLDWMAGRGLL